MFFKKAKGAGSGAADGTRSPARVDEASPLSPTRPSPPPIDRVELKPPATTPTATAPASGEQAAAITTEGAPVAQATKVTTSNDPMRALGELVSVLTRTEAFRQMTLAELATVARPAIASGQFAIASAETPTRSNRAPVAVVLWAQVAPDVEQMLLEGRDGPVQLTPVQWSSGDSPWIMLSAGDPRVLSNLVSEVSAHRFNGRALRVRIKQANGRYTVQSLP